MKKLTERFKRAEELLKYSPEDQRVIEESFRLNRKTVDSPASFTRKPQRRETSYQEIIREVERKEKKERENFFTLIKEFWEKGNEGVPFEERKKLLFKDEVAQDFKMNTDTPIFEEMRTKSKNRQRNLRIHCHSKSETVRLNTEGMSPQCDEASQTAWLKLEKRVNSLCRSEYMSPKEPLYDIAAKSEKDNRELWESEYGSVKARRSYDNVKSEIQKFSIFRKLAAPKTKSLPKTKLSGKMQHGLQKILGDSACTSNDESQKSSSKDVNSTMNTTSSQQDSPLLYSPILLPKECLTPQHKKSRFNHSRTSSLKSKMQVVKSDLHVVTLRALPKRSSNLTKTDGTSFRSSRQLTLPPLNRCEKVKEI